MDIFRLEKEDLTEEPSEDSDPDMIPDGDLVEAVLHDTR